MKSQLYLNIFALHFFFFFWKIYLVTNSPQEATVAFTSVPGSPSIQKKQLRKPTNRRPNLAHVGHRVLFKNKTASDNLRGSSE